MSRVACVALLCAVGCGGPAAAPPAPAAVAPVPQAVRERLLDGAIAVLDRLDEFDEAGAYAQVFDRLNQWSHALPAAAAAGWRVEPLVDTLPERCRPLADAAVLASSTFDAAGDVTALRDARWLSDIAATVGGPASSAGDLAVADALFRWTVRCLAPVSDPPMVPTASNPGSRWMLPGEILLAGRASGPQRAWIFLELLRHAGLDGVMLATGDPEAGTLRPWLPAVISEGEAYLFEPVYGMPIPGPDGRGVATARQAAADPTILARMSVPDRPYPVQAKDASRLTVLVPADPWTLSSRMALLEQSLSSGEEMRLSVEASALGGRALAALPGEPVEGRVRLWDFPWETVLRRRGGGPSVVGALQRELGPLTVAFAQPVEGRSGPRVVRPLLAARIREFRGDLDGPEGAKASYLAARPGRQAIATALRGAAPDRADALKRLYDQMKEDATYWLGVLTLAEGDHAAAIDYLQRMTLVKSPDSRWTDAARLNLAQALIAEGRDQEAAALLREDASPQRFGSRLLADRLEARGKTAAESAEPPEKAAAEREGR